MIFYVFLLLVLENHVLCAKEKVRRHQKDCVFDANSYSFNFTKHINKNGDYIIKINENIVFRLQLCRQLIKKCNNTEGFAICLNKNNSEIGIAKYPPKINTTSNPMTFNYIGDKCKNNSTYSVSIKMICDLTVQNGIAGLKILSNEYNTCNFNMEWRTAAACSSITTTNCTVDSNSIHYNLNKLRNLTDNYEVSINDTHSIILNICQSIFYQPNICHKHSGACLIIKKPTSSEYMVSTSIGEPSNLKFSKNQISLVYTVSNKCFEQSTCIKTTILFICDLNAKKSLPQYKEVQLKSHFLIEWKTVYACDKQDTEYLKNIPKIEELTIVKNIEANKLVSINGTTIAGIIIIVIFVILAIWYFSNASRRSQLINLIFHFTGRNNNNNNLGYSQVHFEKSETSSYDKLIFDKTSKNL